MAAQLKAFEVEELGDPGPLNLSEYTEETLEKHAGGAGRFQILYLVLLGLPWSYSSLLAMSSMFTGNDDAIGMVNCSAVGEPFALPPLNGSAGAAPLPVANSLVTEFGLLCERHRLNPLLSTLYFLGFMIGVPAFGAFSDRFGRRIAYLVPLVIVQIASVSAAFAPSYQTYAAARVLEGFGIAGFGLVAYVWCAEMLGAELRPLLTFVPNVLWSVGQILLSLLAYLLREWRHLTLAMGLLCLGFFAYFPILVESPQWLASKGRADEVYKVLCKIAKVNRRRKPPPPNIKPLAVDSEEVAPGGSLLQLLDTRLLGRFLIMCLNWFTTSMGYFGLSLNATSLPLNGYWANVVGALVAIPAYYLASVMIEWPAWGRKGAVSFGFLLCGGCLLLSTLGGSVLPTVLYYVATSAISMVFAVIYVYASELFPTDIRGASMGLQSLCGRIGAMAAPFVGDLGNKNLTLVVFAAPCVAAGLATLSLPETRGKPLPGTIDEIDGGVSEGLSEEEESSSDDESQ